MALRLACALAPVALLNNTVRLRACNHRSLRAESCLPGRDQ